MSRTDPIGEQPHRNGREDRGRQGPRGAFGPSKGGGRAIFKRYKSEQGKALRVGTFVGVGAVLAWGVKFLYDRLSIYQGDEAWRLLITIGIPIALPVALGAVIWWIVFAHRGTGDFMIATEGEMKKVSWSSRSEVIGSTKVVIMFTALLAILLFVVDLMFQQIFHWLNVLKA